MIQLIPNGNPFKWGCDGLVNTVNVAGVMGKGIGPQFRQRFPGCPDVQIGLPAKSRADREDVGLASRPRGAAPDYQLPDQEVEGQAKQPDQDEYMTAPLIAARRPPSVCATNGRMQSSSTLRSTPVG